MATRPAYVYNGSGWDDIGDKRIGAEAGDIPQASVEDLTSDLASKLDLAGGKILQIVRATDTTDRSTSSGSFVDVTGMSVAITPSSNTSAVIIIATFDSFVTRLSTLGTLVEYRITDSSNNAIAGAEKALSGYTDRAGNAERNIKAYFSMFAYSTPATTSSTTYKLQFSCPNLNDVATVNNATTTGTMYAIEVSA